MDQKSIKIAYAELLNCCWEDPTYLERFRKDPAAVLKEHGLPTLDGARYHVVEQTPECINIVLPENAPAETAKILTADLKKKAGESFKGEVKVLNNTAKDIYLLYQDKPEGFELTDAQLNKVTAAGVPYFRDYYDTFVFMRKDVVIEIEVVGELIGIVVLLAI